MLSRKYRSGVLCIGQVTGAAVGYWLGSAIGDDVTWRLLGVVVGLLYGTLLAHEYLSGWKH